MTSRINLRDKIYLIGNYSQQIVGSKLPSIKQVLDVLFYNLRLVKFNVRDSARLAIQEVLIFWEKARIPTREVKHCIAKLEALYGEWRTLQKHAGRVTESHKQKETKFVSKFNDLFDIAYASALDIMTIEEDKLSLTSQRQKDRPGFMGGIDFQHAKKEKRREEREAKAWARKRSSINELEEARKTVLMETSSSSSTADEVTVDEVNVQEQAEHFDLLQMESGPSKPKKRRGRREIMTAKLVAVFDRCKIRRHREHSRKETAETLKKLFKESDLDAVVVHWDGKLVPCMTHFTQHNVTVDRLPVIVISGDIEQLLGVPLIEAGTGRQQAVGIYELLNDWALTDKKVSANTKKKMIEAINLEETSTNKSVKRVVIQAHDIPEVLEKNIKIA
ncbi:adenylate kinase 9-like protein [Lasius niger]|uniref:Adenylate kinase 9-like protein n=1 Tax=Lasius niger TaxID=67767 RepID=A0A0J7K5W2_LASNI|nr:adenylate kinase 9-like protein [Lasius niger]